MKLIATCVALSALIAGISPALAIEKTNPTMKPAAATCKHGKRKAACLKKKNIAPVASVKKSK